MYFIQAGIFEKKVITVKAEEDGGDEKDIAVEIGEYVPLNSVPAEYLLVTGLL